MLVDNLVVFGGVDIMVELTEVPVLVSSTIVIVEGATEREFDPECSDRPVFTVERKKNPIPLP